MPYLGTALVLLGLAGLSRVLPGATRSYPTGFPPLQAWFVPRVGPGILAVVGLAMAAWALIRRALRAPRTVFLLAAVAFGWMFALALATQYPHPRTESGCCAAGGPSAVITAPLRHRGDYWANVSLVEHLGPRRYAAGFPSRSRSVRGEVTLHASTHPPGAVLILWGLSRLTGGSLLTSSLLVALIGVLGAVPTYAVARAFHDERTSRVAVVLFVCCPAVLLFAVTSMDVVFMTAIAIAAVAVVRAPRSNAWAAAGGALTAAALCLTYSALVLLPVGLGVGLLALRSVRRRTVVRRGVVAVLALIASVALIRLATGIDLVACFRTAVRLQASYPAYRIRPYGYWIWANVAGFLLAVGIGHAALLVAETRDRWRDRRPGLESVLWAAMLLSSAVGMFKGETDHIWLFFVPMLAAAAAPAAAPAAAVRGPATGGLAQAAVTEVLFFTRW